MRSSAVTTSLVLSSLSRRRVVAWIGGLLGCACLLAPLPIQADQPVAKPQDAKKFDETWQVIYAGKSRIGFSRSSRGTKMVDGKEIVQTENETVMVLARFGQQLKVRTVVGTEETNEGDLLAFRYEMSNPPSTNKVTTGHIADGKLVLLETSGKRTSTKSVPWDASQKSPGYLERMLRENPLKPGDKRTFKAFAPELNVMTEITVNADKYEEVPLLEGKTRKLLKVAIEQSVMPGLTVDEYVDETGEPQKVALGLLGMTMYTVPKSVALQQLSGAEVDLGLSTLVKVRGVEEAGRARKVVYRLRAPNEDLTRIVARGSSQSLEVLEKGVGDVTVQVVVPPLRDDSKETGDNLQQYLKPNRYLQSDDPLVIELANKAVGDETDPWKASVLMEKWVYKNLQQKNFSVLLDTAAEVAKSLSGDCTEHSVLLAGMARAKKIPSRCVVGLVYAPSLAAFGGHMWTEVYINGAWIPLDATLGKGGIGPDHIKFSDTSFADSAGSAPLSTFIPLVSVLGKLSIEVQKIEK